VTVYDTAGRELDYADGFRQQQDSVLIFKVPKSGDYVLEVRDSLYRGREDLVYRLSVGALPLITDVYPLGGKRGTTVPVKLHGVNLAQTTLNVTVPQDGSPVMCLATTAQGLASNRVKFEAGDLDETAEVEPNDTPQTATRVSVGSIVNGRIGKPGEVDYFVFKAAAQQNLVVEVRARRLGSPLDSVIALFDSKGQLLAQNDDIENDDAPPLTHQADSRLEFKVPADGDYIVRLRDAQRKGGPEYAYRLSIAPNRPDFVLTTDIPADQSLEVAPGGEVKIPLKAVRGANARAAISLSLEQPPWGFAAKSGQIEAGKSECTLSLTVDKSARLGRLQSVIFSGTMDTGKEKWVRYAPAVLVKVTTTATKHPSINKLGGVP
jgi:hypothetical protein